MVNQRVRILIISLLMTWGLLSGTVEAVHAQPVLVATFPVAEEVITFSPGVVTLTFDRALSEEDLVVSVTDENGDEVTAGDPMIDPAERFTVETPLEPLPNGVYTVSYRVRAVGGSVAISDTFTFTIQLPAPQLYLMDPIDGSAIYTDSITLQMRIESVSFEYYDTRINVYFDGVLLDSIDKIEYPLTGLEPGVHEIKVILTQHDQELYATEKIVHVTVVEPTPEPAALTEMGITFTPARWAVVIIASAALVAVGYFIGLRTRGDSPANGEES